MASATRQSIAAGKQQLTPLLAKADLKFAKELFDLGAALATSSQLRGILSDPSAESGAKSGIVKAVFDKSVSSASLDFLTGLVALRWSRPRDLVVALEQLGVHAVASIAAKAGTIAEVESALFAFQSAITSDSELQFALADKNAPAEAKAKLAEALVGKRRASVVLGEFAKQVAAFAERLVAVVTVAGSIDKAQIARIEKSLSANYGHPMTVNVEVDPSILGGVRIQVAGDVIDGSIETRLKAAKLQLA
jgi:F-type H+-transporting ATPase subunit delta